jgi:DNA topoisomerase-1
MGQAVVALVIVESPAKAKTINKYLGRDYEVVASFGHVRDLPSKDGSVEPDNDFTMTWEVDGKASKRVSEIAAAVRNADRLILATDPDREGEAISWHLLEILKNRRVLKGIDVQRVTFNAITKQAVEDAMARPRPIDQALVDAYLARRALDYLVGFNLSPVLWRKLPGARSAGRVQSVALRLVCERENEIERFVPREYWSLVAHLRTEKGESFEARLVGADGKKLNRLDVGTETDAMAFRQALEAANFRVSTVDSKPVKRHPAPPFTTSTLQQEASRKLGLAPAITMRVAQKLYEGIDIGGETAGLITYMRTDGVQMDGSAVAQTRRLIANDYGDRYLPGVPRAYSTKAKNAQEAHEAIRPTDLFRTPDRMARFLSGDDLKLYELIWKRTVASQMESAELERTTVDIAADMPAGYAVVPTTGEPRRYNRIDLRATGQVIRFDGFLTLYMEGRDDEEDEENRRLPLLRQNEALKRERIAATQHFTEPPPRYSEASLVKRMEELGIGRPSTYAATLAVLREREYVRLDKKRLHAEDKGRLVTAFLESFFHRYVEYDFTADLEGELDRISNNEVDWKAVMRAFWEEFSAAINGTKELRTTQVIDALDEMLEPHLFPRGKDGADSRGCPRCGTGRLGLRLAKSGPFIGCSNYPECRYTRPFGVPTADGNGVSPDGVGQDGVRRLGLDPVTGLEVTAREGRYGPYVQLGEGEKPKRSTIPKGYALATITLEEALKLLVLPREVGRHPEDGEPIIANLGRFGPYVQHGKTYANLPEVEDVFVVGLNRAVDLIAEKRTKGAGGRFGRGAGPKGRPLGEHPEGGPVQVMDGRYGAYVTWGKVNATLPKGTDKDALTLEAALPLLAAKIEASGGTLAGKGKRAAAGKAKAASGKTAATKTTATKTAASNGAAKAAKAKPKAPKAAAPKATEASDAAPKPPARKTAAKGAKADAAKAGAAKPTPGKAASRAKGN